MLKKERRYHNFSTSHKIREEGTRRRRRRRKNMLLAHG
jgi:hypothetical protein